MLRTRIVQIVSLALLFFGPLRLHASDADETGLNEPRIANTTETAPGNRRTKPSFFLEPSQSSTDSFSVGNLDGNAQYKHGSQHGGFSEDTLRSLMRPRVAFNSEWLTSSDFDLSSYDLRVSVPTYPFFGPPPPLISGGFGYTNLVDAASLELPEHLFDYSIGLSWMRPVNDRWMVRSMLGVAFATDNVSVTSDAWQFRGGVFAVFEPDENWQWVIGAIAIGRNDLPVVPAVGVIWKPAPDLKFNFTLPKPKISKLVMENLTRQQWAYLGMGLNGGTWAYQRTDGSSDQLTYGDWRVVIGWESLPTPVAGQRFTPGAKFGLELGYVFSRDLEFRSDSADISLTDAVILGMTTRF